jgi:hypothetical protein
MSETSIRPALAPAPPVRSGLTEPKPSLSYTVRPDPEPAKPQAVAMAPQPVRAAPEPQPPAPEPAPEPGYAVAARVVLIDRGYGSFWMLLPGAAGDVAPVAAGNDPDACARAVSQWAAKATGR